ncbi:MAG TPA: sigma-70 family RNA polymerase sigma factor, partial [Polyangiaceae bacterium]|nr:sigma-70 family RNA polymerase sigma factor [Polyangiaceae bacterium]
MLTDEALLAKVGLRDEAALGMLHRRHAALIFTVAARIVDPGAAEEVVQDVFLTVWQKHDTFDEGRGSFKNWVLQIARRRALNQLRRRTHERADEPSLELAPDEGVLPDEASWRARKREAIR